MSYVLNPLARIRRLVPALLVLAAILLASGVWPLASSDAGPVTIPSVALAEATNALHTRVAALSAASNALNTRVTTAEGQFGALGATNIVIPLIGQTNTFYFNAKGVLTNHAQVGP